MDAAESEFLRAWPFPHLFQSAAASWTRRNCQGALDVAVAERFQSAAASWTRRNAEHVGAVRDLDLFQSAAASWTRRNAVLIEQPLNHLGFNPPPRRGRGGMPRALERGVPVEVSIRRRVVDAAE